MMFAMPPEVEKSILDAVQSGRFRSVGEAIATAWTEWNRAQATVPNGRPPDEGADPLMGLWQDYADEIDEIVDEAYRRRREESWRELEP